MSSYFKQNSVDDLSCQLLIKYKECSIKIIDLIIHIHTLNNLNS